MPKRTTNPGPVDIGCLLQGQGPGPLDYCFDGLKEAEEDCALAGRPEYNKPNRPGLRPVAQDAGMVQPSFVSTHHDC